MKITMAAAIFAVGLVLAFGGYLTFLGLRNVVHAAQSRRWPTTAGTVVSAATERTTTTNRDTQITHVDYSTKTVVRYHAAGRDYTTNLIHFGQTLGSDDPSEAELQRLRYPPGAAVQVSYHPTQPWLAVLRPGIHTDAFSRPAGGLAFFLPGIMMVLILPDWFGSSSGFGGRDRSGAAVAGIMAFIFSVLGVLALGAGISRIWNGHASQRWPTTLGEVIFARVEASQSQDEETGEHQTTFSPRFVYRYQVDGATHFNNLRRFGRVEGQGGDWADQLATQYPVGTCLQVAYFPGDPDVAVLETGNDKDALWLPGIGMFALLMGLAAFIWFVPAVARG